MVRSKDLYKLITTFFLENSIIERPKNRSSCTTKLVFLELSRRLQNVLLWNFKRLGAIICFFVFSKLYLKNSVFTVQYYNNTLKLFFQFSEPCHMHERLGTVFQYDWYSVLLCESWFHSQWLRFYWRVLWVCSFLNLKEAINSFSSCSAFRLKILSKSLLTGC